MWSLALIIFYHASSINPTGSVGITNVGTYETQQECEEAGETLMKKFDTVKYNYKLKNVSMLTTTKSSMFTRTHQAYHCKEAK